MGPGLDRKTINLSDSSALDKTMSSLRAVIEDILLSRDFETFEREGVLIGRKGSVEVFILLLRQPDERRLRQFLEKTKGQSGRRVVATLAPLDERSRKEISEEVMVWTREDIEHELGRVHLERLLGHRDQSLVDEFEADDYPRTVPPSELESASSDLGEKIVKPHLDLETVKKIAAQRVGGFRYRLELVPHYVHRYTCSLFIDEHRLGSKGGIVAIDALSGRSTDWQEGVELTGSLNQSHQRLEPNLDPEEAHALAVEEVMRRHTSEQDFVRESGPAVVTERKTVSPKRDQIMLEDLGLYYLPLWCIEGVRGVMIIDAGTGRTLSEDIYTQQLP
jgi:hypothetical protein